MFPGDDSNRAAHKFAGREGYAAVGEGSRHPEVHRGAAEQSDVCQPGERRAAGGTGGPEAGEAAAPCRAGGKDGDGISITPLAVCCCSLNSP